MSRKVLIELSLRTVVPSLWTNLTEPCGRPYVDSMSARMLFTLASTRADLKRLGLSPEIALLVFLAAMNDPLRSTFFEFACVRLAQPHERRVQRDWVSFGARSCRRESAGLTNFPSWIILAGTWPAWPTPRTLPTCAVTV